jgi:hypothetical protein
MPSRDSSDLRDLREAYASGRLTLDEFAECVATVLGTDAAAPARLDPFDEHLVAGEKVLWVGRPDPAKRFSKSDRFAIPFSLMWGGFAIFWEATAIAGGAGPFFALWGIPFVAIGVYIMVGRFFYRARLKRRTWFAVTNKRALKLERRKNGDAVEALFLDTIPAVNRDVGKDGSGSVLFGSAGRWQSDLANSGMPAFFLTNVQLPLTFYDIPDAAHVAELVTQLRQAQPERELH